ncbi:hypothetical protein [Lacinutrix algicola]|uniref:hypothetical protein n=1 Tax=Lacinutrix algicola TaxID=342954 RepID=UPI0006E3613E|nr:hypothetical protein [Lacinutrix algicola]
MIKNLVQKNIKLIVILIGILLLSFIYFYNSYYFDFDKIEHYTFIEKIDYFDIENDSVKIENKELLSSLLFDRKPTKLNGIEFINELDKVATKKRDIPISDFQEIKEIFKEQSCSVNVAYSCISVFRDILVFYQKNKVVGIAKICFSCNDHHIIGTTSNTSDFGQCGKYEELNKILK